jgi:F0F1-type ATP synthase assembly protein I
MPNPEYPIITSGSEDLFKTEKLQQVAKKTKKEREELLAEIAQYQEIRDVLQEIAKTGQASMNLTDANETSISAAAWQAVESTKNSNEEPTDKSGEDRQHELDKAVNILVPLLAGIMVGVSATVQVINMSSNSTTEKDTSDKIVNQEAEKNQTFKENGEPRNA